MKEQFVTYEISLSFKELGFNKPCFGYYDGRKDLELDDKFPCQNSDTMFNCSNTLDYACAPLWQQAIDWLRETKNIVITVDYYEDKNSVPFYSYTLQGIGIGYLTNPPSGMTVLDNEWWFTSIDEYEYFDAREKAVLSAIELLKR
jgi:hypothetical protein